MVVLAHNFLVNFSCSHLHCHMWGYWCGSVMCETVLVWHWTVCLTVPVGTDHILLSNSLHKVTVTFNDRSGGYWMGCNDFLMINKLQQIDLCIYAKKTISSYYDVSFWCDVAGKWTVSFLMPTHSRLWRNVFTLRWDSYGTLHSTWQVW